ncbi:MAG: biopolymer transporter ExbD [Candidatus Krumholzibacteria bacterium]|nr:biopolymer transporter ExbD [Candidatus Krumholzibacteria bacterium]
MKRFTNYNLPQTARMNLTPIIDVALVLVIILLITAPMLSVADIDVDLPTAQTRGAEDEGRISITLGKTGELAVNEDIVTPDKLREILKMLLAKKQNNNTLVVVRADQEVPYELIRVILREAREAGANRLAIATLQSNKGNS